MMLARILNTEAIPSEMSPRCKAYKSHTMLFSRISKKVGKETPAVEPLERTAHTWGYSATPDTKPLRSARRSIK